VPRTEPVDWRPGADPDLLKLRADLLARVRAFFAERGVMEVDTPILGQGAATDPAIACFTTDYLAPGCVRGVPLTLHSSPEFCMKRLLAAGSGPIYQLSHVFRNGESGRRHNPEFMLLEWYRPGFSPAELMDEIDALMSQVLQGYLDYQPARRITYRQWFVDETGLDPWTDSLAAFRKFARERLGSLPDHMPDDVLDPWLDLLLTHWLEPRLTVPALFVQDYPPSQASLARLQPQPAGPVAERFELYVRGAELANGFHELADSGEQRQRFEQENRLRQRSGQPQMPLDEALLAALDHGLPDCSGVALGFDRLVMLVSGRETLDSVMPFSLERV